jgi:hypothetical protein
VNVLLKDTQETIEIWTSSIQKNRKFLAEYQPKSFDNDIYFNVYHGLYDDQLIVALAKYCIDSDAAAFKQAVVEVVEGYLPVLNYQGLWSYRKFAMPYVLFVAMQPKAEIVRISKESSANRIEYASRPGSWSFKYRHIMMYDRILNLFRSYFLEDREWMNEELEIVKNIRVARDEGAFSIPKKWWYPFFWSLFNKDEAIFSQTLKEIVKWYHRTVQRQTIDRLGAYHYSGRVNYPALAALKIANAYQGMSVEVDDFFVPKDLINWS